MHSPRRVSSHQLAYDYLRSEVLVDPSVQGTFLSEQEIAEGAGVSRTPVREAFRVLASEGLVELIPHRGAFVPRVTTKQVGDLFEFRRVLECYAAEVILAKGIDPTPDMVSALERQQELVGSSDGDATIRFIALDREFHFHLMKAADNAEIEQTYERISTRQRVIGARALNHPSRRSDVCAEHRAIVDAIRSGDLQAAREAISAHLAITESVLRSGPR
ncbi:GntR family transcriptional regulator [Leucobacter sp. CSA1]|uniref:GntR family transcriptional regulator n=1 Tax=Leucobacter chromiisoli TaxID=2796471 RepID=A0A934Q787_9MICO|nr:GntR family transcriptional regulator [Leucobacter chromiisoli]MBK0419580.1 GntR family transcriptional regulator [Leucobacter chromiisoli]